MSDGYLRQRQFYEDISGTLTVDSQDTDPVAVPLNTSRDALFQTIFVQRGTITILSPGVPGTTWTLGDDQAGFITQDYPVGVDDPVEIPFDFGAIGRPITEGAAFIIATSAPGAGGLMSFEGYRKLTGVGASANP